MLPRVAPWSPSADRWRTPVGKSVRNLGKVRVLQDEDTPGLWALINRDPVANVYLAAQLEAAGTAGSGSNGARIIGYDDGGQLASACWMGVNLVPVGVTAEQGPAYARYLEQTGRKFSSIFGPAEGVLGIWSRLQWAWPKPFDVRPDQPLLELRSASPVRPRPGLRPARADELDVLLPACVAMFEEEVGYSPTAAGDDYYRNRIRGLIKRGHSLLDRGEAGEVVFKAELGTVSTAASQIQGVWMNPQYRGRGLSAGYMSAVVRAARRHAPVASLYVNSYNSPALAAYRKVGFEQVGTFATVLM